MKSCRRVKTKALISLGIIIVLSVIISYTLNFNPGRIDKKLKYSNDTTLENENLKISKVSGKIHIDGNSGWYAAMIAGTCTGNGTYSEPYVIEDLVIDGGDSGSCIWIENSDVYFKIENCSTYNSSSGIRLSHVLNSLLINNNCSANDIGISLYDSYHNTIAGNTLNYNIYKGISLTKSDHNNILGNEISYSYYGILLEGGSGPVGEEVIRDNIISGNMVNSNTEYGIFLYHSSNNSISNNTVNDNNGDGIILYLSYRNIVSENVISSNNGNGISLSLGIDNTLSENTIKYNHKGIYLYQSDSNNVIGNNLIGNSICWEEFECENNIFENNNCRNELIIQGYKVFFLIGIFPLVIIIVRKKIRKLGKT